jgi:hypothetical protein
MTLATAPRLATQCGSRAPWLGSLQAGKRYGRPQAGACRGAGHAGRHSATRRCWRRSRAGRGFPARSKPRLPSCGPPSPRSGEPPATRPASSPVRPRRGAPPWAALCRRRAVPSRRTDAGGAIGRDDLDACTVCVIGFRRDQAETRERGTRARRHASRGGARTRACALHAQRRRDGQNPATGHAERFAGPGVSEVSTRPT